ncbi:hypothetical protein N9K35_04465 [Pseudomonadales bacterium]|nr:hypothetical protein [Pseudomonadales bacterium]
MFKRPTVGVVVGFGSVGKKHAALLKTFCQHVYIYDKKIIDTVGGEYIVFEDINLLCQELAIIDSSIHLHICTWADSHLTLVKYFSDQKLSIVSMIVEKPLANSLNSCLEIEKIALAEKIPLSVNFSRSGSNLAARIRDLFVLHNDELKWIDWDGFGQCIVTVGIHWLSLSNNILKDLPVSCIYDLGFTKTNPRSSDLFFVHGSINYIYEGGVNLKMRSFQSEEGSAELVFHGARISIKLERDRLVISNHRDEYIDAVPMFFNFEDGLRGLICSNLNLMSNDIDLKTSAYLIVPTVHAFLNPGAKSFLFSDLAAASDLLASYKVPVS